MSINFCIIDFVLNFNMGTNAWVIIPVGIVFFFIYYFGFKFMIEKFDLKTPGREDDFIIEEDISEEELNIKLESSNYQYMAKKLLQNVGGKENIEEVESCVTRLSLELKDVSFFNEVNIKKTGAKGIVKLSDTSIQIIIGTEVNKVAKEFKEMLED